MRLISIFIHSKGILFLIMEFLFLGSTLCAQQTNIRDYVLFSGNGTGAGSQAQKPPLAPGYAVQLGSFSNIQGGSVGSYQLVKSTGNTTITITGSYFENHGTLIIHGRIEALIVNLDNLNTCTNNGTLSFSNSGGFNNWSSLINNGTINIDSLASFYNSPNSTLTNNGTLNNYAIYPSGSFSNPGTLDNYGTLNNYGQFNNLEPGFFNTTAVLNNYAIIINIANGIFNSAGTLNNNATLNNNPGGQMIIQAGSPGSILNNNAGGTLINAGSFWESGDSTNIINNGTLTNITGGTITNDGTLENNSIFTNAGTLTNNAILNNNTSDSLHNNGTIENNGTLGNSGILINNGTLNNINILNNNPGGNLILNTTSASFPGGTFNWNIGSTVIIGQSGSMTLTSPLTVETGRTFVIAKGLFINQQ